MNIYPNFDIMFEHRPKSSRIDLLPKQQPSRRAQKRGSGSSGLDRIHMIAGVGRLEGGSLYILIKLFKAYILHSPI